ncbi:MAG: type VI secretion system baseplate subunit TssK [Planctomycetes bacterium]|nr:type VI secretion system baseplate subunit TssK [Planctomycetota bacterium]
MDNQPRVLWTEGMFLTPQHLQQWDRYWQGQLQARLGALAGYGWGMREMAADLDALSGGQFNLTRCDGVMPDGTVFSVPGGDDVPAARDVAPHFGPDRERLGVFLALPVAAESGVSVAPGGHHDGSPTRFKSKQFEVKDFNPGGGKRTLTQAASNLRILFEGEALDDHTWLKIAELSRTATGGFALAEGFVPATLRIASSPRLMAHLRKILEILSTKSTEFSRQRRDRGAGLASFSTSEAASFWLLHTVNGGLPPLQHIFATGHAHPEAVYLELARLAGFLFTFASDGHPKDLPPYQHEDLAQTFARMEEKLRALLDTIIPTKCTNIPLSQTRDTMFAAKIADDRVLQPEGALYVAVTASVPAEKVVREVPLKFKISSTDRVDQLITAALRGLSVRHVPAPPPEIPVQPGRQYFQIDKSGEHWEAVRGSHSMSFYLPPEFQGLKLELMAVKE